MHPICTISCPMIFACVKHALFLILFSLVFSSHFFCKVKPLPFWVEIRLAPHWRDTTAYIFLQQSFYSSSRDSNSSYPWCMSSEKHTQGAGIPLRGQKWKSVEVCSNAFSWKSKMPLVKFKEGNFFVDVTITIKVATAEALVDQTHHEPMECNCWQSLTHSLDRPRGPNLWQ